MHIGITGGIGSGKTFVANIFESYRIPVYYADERAKWLMLNHAPLKESIIELLGPEAFLKNELNKKWIADLIFNHQTLLESLNNIVHPAVEEDFIDFCQIHRDEPYLLKEAALLIETGSYIELDKLILVVCNEKTRIDRVIARDHSTQEQVKARIGAQFPEEKKIPLADFIIINDGTQDIEAEVKQIHLQLMIEANP